MNTSLILLADGQGTRWGNHLGLPKHLVPLEDGTPLLYRTVWQFTPQSPTSTLVVVGPDSRYRVPPCPLVRVHHQPDLYEADRFYCCRPMWADPGRTVLLFGDVWYSGHAVDEILTPRDGWQWFARPGASTLTGCPYGEGFAFAFTDEIIPHLEATLAQLVDLRREGKIDRAQGWQLYRMLAGSPPDDYTPHDELVPIDDWTDDFDSPADYHRWMSRRKETACSPG